MNISGIGYKPAFKSIVVEKASLEGLDSEKDAAFGKEINELNRFKWLSGSYWSLSSSPPFMKDYVVIETSEPDKKKKEENVSGILTKYEVNHKIVEDDFLKKTHLPEYMFKDK